MASNDREQPGRGRALKHAPSTGDVVASRPRRNEEPDDGPLEQDIERFSDPTRPCPECKKDVFDDSAVCYHCGHAFERTTAGSSQNKPWVVIVIAVVLVAFGLLLLRGLV